MTGLVTDHGTIRTSMVIDAAGPWALALARSAGLDLPIVPVRHEYFISEPVAGWHADLPVLRLPDQRLYVRADLSSVLCGGWEAAALSLDPRTEAGGVDVAPDPDWEVLAGFAESFEPFVPGITSVGIRQTFRGWPTFTPDGRFVVGPVPGLRGFVMAAGCNAHGVSGSAGPGPARRREPGPGAVALRALAQPGPLPGRRLDVGGRPRPGAADLPGLLRRDDG